MLLALHYWSLMLGMAQVDFLADAIVEIVRSQGPDEAERILILFSMKLSSKEELHSQRDEDAIALGGQKDNLQAGQKRRRPEDDDEDEPLGPLVQPPSHHPSHYSIDELLMVLVEAAADAEAASSPFARLDQSVLARTIFLTPTRTLLQGTWL